MYGCVTKLLWYEYLRGYIIRAVRYLLLNTATRTNTTWTLNKEVFLKRHSGTSTYTLLTKKSFWKDIQVLLHTLLTKKSFWKNMQVLLLSHKSFSLLKKGTETNNWNKWSTKLLLLQLISLDLPPHQMRFYARWDGHEFLTCLRFTTMPCII